MRIPKLAGLILLIGMIFGCGSPGIKTADNAQEQFQLAKREFDKKHYLKAIEGFQKVIFNFPGATVVDTAQYYLAQSYFQNEDYALAAVEFNRLISNYPKSDFVDDAQYMAGVCYFKSTPGHYALDQEDLKKAISAMEDFIVDNPDSPLLESAREVILKAQTRLAHKEYENGMLYWKMSDLVAAEIYFQLVVDEYTSTPYGSLALFKLGEVNYRLQRLATALEKFNSFLSIYPTHELVPEAKEYIARITPQLDSANVADGSK
ncbi:MAG: outer membrane protein assembly factor BamD [Candidatus Zixiibacteriota bacterium]